MNGPRYGLRPWICMINIHKCSISIAWPGQMHQRVLRTTIATGERWLSRHTGFPFAMKKAMNSTAHEAVTVDHDLESVSHHTYRVESVDVP